MNKVDTSKYSTEIDTSEMQELILAPLPDIVEGRVLQLDADIAIYECTYNENDTLEDCKNNLLALIEKYRVYAGAERVVCHLTGTLKGNRFKIATVKPYQGNRKDKIKPKLHKELFNWLRFTVSNKPQGTYLDCQLDIYYNELEEADDSMTQFHYNNPNSVICSRDKDLRMNAGKHLNWDTLELHEVDAFGYLELKEWETKSGVKKKKVYGEGTLWFWFQMLAGDTADNIAGLPKIESKTGKLVNCGEIRAYEAIMDYKDNGGEGILSDMDMYVFISGLYDEYYIEGFRDFERSEGMFIEQAKLLWMRRFTGEDDCLRWFKEIGC